MMGYVINNASQQPDALSALPELAGGETLCLHVGISNGALLGDALPNRIKLLNWGANPTATKGDVIVNEVTASVLPRAQSAMGFDRVVLDYNHQSEPAHPNYRPDPREHAAYGTPELVPGDGLYLSNLQYTPSGEANARNYADLSPVVLRNKAGEVLMLKSAALCPNGEVHGLSFFSADGVVPPAKTQKKPMFDAGKILREILGLAPESSDEEVMSKITAYKAAEKSEKPSENKDAALSALQDQVTALTAQFDTINRNAILAEAAKAGKVVSESVRALPLAHLSAVIADLPAGVVPLGQQTPDNVTALSGSGVGAHDSMLDEIASKCGVDPAEVRKTKI